MTRLAERGYRFWRNLAWIFAGAAVVGLVGSVLAILDGSRTGWISLVLTFFVGGMSVAYFRLYRRLRQVKRGQNPGVS